MRILSEYLGGWFRRGTKPSAADVATSAYNPVQLYPNLLPHKFHSRLLLPQVLYPTDAAMGLRAALAAVAAAEGAEAMRCEVEALPAADGTEANTEEQSDSGALVLSVQLALLSATDAASARRAAESLATVAAAALRRTLPESSLQLTVRMVSAEPPQAARSLSRRMALPVAALQVSFPYTPYP